MKTFHFFIRNAIFVNYTDDSTISEEVSIQKAVQSKSNRVEHSRTIEFFWVSGEQLSMKRVKIICMMVCARGNFEFIFIFF